MLRYAMGWLGWTPEVALHTPFPLIELALEGKVDFLTATTPGAKRKPRKPKTQADLKAKIKAVLGAARGGAGE